MALSPLSPSLQAQYVQVFLLNPEPFSKFSADLGSTNRSATSHLLFFDSCSALATVFLPSFLLPKTFWQEPSSPSSFTIKLQWVPGHSFLQGNNVAGELARRGALLVPSANSCSLSPLTSRIHVCLFLDWRHTLSFKFFDTKVPSVSTEKLALPHHAHYALSLSSLL